MEKLGEIIGSTLGKKLIPKPQAKTTKPQEPQDISLNSIDHELSNLLTIIRNRCEVFALNIEENRYKDKSDKELVKMAVQIMNIVIESVDRATDTLQKIPSLVKKKKQ